MKTIPLTKGQIALVDDEDFERLNKFKWHAIKPRNSFYAARTIRSGGKKYMVYMHREIAGAPSGFLVDHRDGNGLNNQRENIRVATHSQNARNCRRHTDGSSRFKGVTWNKEENKWLAQLGISGKHVHLGLFVSEIDAAKAYDSAAKKCFGEFARLNL